MDHGVKHLMLALPLNLKISSLLQVKQGLGGSLTSSLQCVVKGNDHEIIYLRSHPTHSDSL